MKKMILLLVLVIGFAPVLTGKVGSEIQKILDDIIMLKQKYSTKLAEKKQILVKKIYQEQEELEKRLNHRIAQLKSAKEKKAKETIQRLKHKIEKTFNQIAQTKQQMADSIKVGYKTFNVMYYRHANLENIVNKTKKTFNDLCLDEHRKINLEKR